MLTLNMTAHGWVKSFAMPLWSSITLAWPGHVLIRMTHESKHHAQNAGSINELGVQDRGDELSRQERELKVTRDELIRTGAVAQRVAASETRGGSKDEGVVPVAMHLEEVSNNHQTIPIRISPAAAAAAVVLEKPMCLL